MTLKVARPIMAGSLIAAGVLAGGLLAATSATPTIAFASGSAHTATAPAAASSVGAASIDAAIEHAFAIASPSVVYVDNTGIGSGSGVIYDSTGDIVTNAHVVAQARHITVTLNSGKTYPARLLGTDTADDLAVLHINASGLPAAHFATAGSDPTASMVIAIGSPLGLQQTVTSGLISALDRTVQEPNGAYLPNAVQTSAPINPGNSGGALVDLSGNVVGIPTLEAMDPQNNSGGAAQGIGFAIPSSRITYIARQIISSGRVEHTGRAYLGVAATDSTQGLGSFGQGGLYPGYGTMQPATVPGALVQTVASGSPAAKAGLQPGDVITAANGMSVSGESDLLVALAKAKPGSTMTLTVNRAGTTVMLHVHLGELSASQ